MRLSRILMPCLVVVACLVFMPAVHAQYFTVQGSVLLDDGNPAIGATFKIEPIAGNKAARNSKVKKNGSFKIPAVEFGTYRFKAEKSGYLMGSLSIVIKTEQNKIVDEGETEIGPMQELPVFDIKPGQTVTVNIGLVPAKFFANDLSIPGNKKASEWLAEANRLSGAGAFEESDELLLRIVETGEATANVYYLLGRNAGATDRSDEAVEYLEKTLELNPEQTGVYAQLATIAHERGEVEKAAEFFRKELEITPDAVPVVLNLAIILVDLDRKEEAIAAFEKVLELSPTEAPAYGELAGLYLAVGQEDRAIETLDRMAEVTAPDPALWFNIGANFSNRDQFAQAQMAYRKALELDPAFPLPHRELGYLLFRDGKQEEALEQFKIYLEMAPDAADADQVSAFVDTLAKMMAEE